MNKGLLVALAAISISMPLPAWGQAIPGLYNTGTDASNVALAGGDGVTDPHYLIFASTSPGFAGNQAVTYFNGAYVANDADSRWISLSSNGNPGSNTTTYRLTFDLTGLNPATASITGSWGADNVATMTLNGSATGNVLTNPSNFSALTAFSILTGFVGGINTLDFIVTDQGPPTALRVDNLQGRAQAINGGAVPEPSTWAMMLLGFGAIGLGLKRARRPGHQARALS